MAYRAVTHILLGIDPVVQPGDPVPESYTDPLGASHSVDFERLVSLGAAESVDENDSDDGEYSKLKVGELKQLADERGLELEGNPKKADLIAALQESDAAAESVDENDSDDGESESPEE